MAFEVARTTVPAYPRTASIVSLVGGLLIILTGVLLIAVSFFVLPHVDYSNLQVPKGLTAASIPGLISGIVGVMGAFGLICGAIVLVSALILLTKTSQRRVCGVLILVFSVLSFIGLGGFVIGAILGIIGGIMTLRWKPPTQ